MLTEVGVNANGRRGRTTFALSCHLRGPSAVAEVGVTLPVLRLSGLGWFRSRPAFVHLVPGNVVTSRERWWRLYCTVLVFKNVTLVGSVCIS